MSPLRPSRKEKRDSPRSDGSPGRYFLCLRLCPSSDRGILRDVTLFALPETCLYDFYAETHLDAAYEDAVLKIGYSSPVVGGAEVAYTLADPSGRRYPLAQSRFP